MRHRAACGERAPNTARVNYTVGMKYPLGPKTLFASGQSDLGLAPPKPRAAGFGPKPLPGAGFGPL